jgi:hypothetical protein
MSWDLIAKVLGVIFSAGAGLYRLRYSVKPRARTNLKADCELLSLFDKSDPSRATLKARIDAQVADLYGPARRGQTWLPKDWLDALREADRPQTVLGVACLAAGAGLTAYLVRNGFTWWSLLTGYIGLLGLGLIMSAFENHGAVANAYNSLGRAAFDLAETGELDPRLSSYIEHIQKLKLRMPAAEPAAEVDPRQEAPVAPSGS